MTPTRPWFVVGLVAVVALVTWAMLTVVYTGLPRLPWTAIPTLLLLALGEAFAGFHLRRRIRRHPGTVPVEPMVVARMAALAKASAYTAALVGGAFAGFALRLADSLAKPIPREDFFVSVGSGVSALVLVGAALLLEHACRVPKGPEDRPRDEDAGRA